MCSVAPLSPPIFVSHLFVRRKWGDGFISLLNSTHTIFWISSAPPLNSTALSSHLGEAGRGQALNQHILSKLVGKLRKPHFDFHPLFGTKYHFQRDIYLFKCDYFSLAGIMSKISFCERKARFTLPYSQKKWHKYRFTHIQNIKKMKNNRGNYGKAKI